MNQKVCRLTMDDGWSIIPIFNSALVSACALWPTAYRGPSEYMLALDGEIALESTENGLALFCRKYKSSDVSVYFTVMNIALD